MPPGNLLLISLLIFTLIILHLPFCPQSTPDAWQELYDSHTPLSLALPGGFGVEGRLDAFQRLLVLRCIIPDKLVPAIQVMGTECGGGGESHKKGKGRFQGYS